MLLLKHGQSFSVYFFLFFFFGSEYREPHFEGTNYEGGGGGGRSGGEDDGIFKKKSIRKATSRNAYINVSKKWGKTECGILIFHENVTRKKRMKSKK